VWHQAESPWLRWNFLGWGVLLVLAAGLVPLAWPARDAAGGGACSARIGGLLLVMGLYGAGVLLYYASGRFRLPLLPVLCVLAGGWADWARVLQCHSREKIISVLAMAAAAFAGFSNFANANDESTFIQDDLLAANAAASLGDDAQAYALAERALTRDPSRPDARRIAVVSFFNLTLSDGDAWNTVAEWRKELQEMQGLELRDGTLALVAGMALWKTGAPAQAEVVWQDSAARFGPDSAPAKALAAAQSLRGESPESAASPDPAMLDYLKIQPR
jgi:hypothetical protein